MSWLPILPPQASTLAPQVDALALFMLAACVAISIAIFTCLAVFSIRYRRRPGNELSTRPRGVAPIETAWTIIPLILTLIPFGWGAKLYLDEAQPPDNALEVFVVARQWMWKAQYPEGQAEINALHVPVGQAIKVTMTSQDVIHGFYVPAFRVKADVLPGRYTTVWFQASQPGDYPLLCSQYCGTDHSRMLGHVVALRPNDYAAWLAGGATATNSSVTRGRQVFEQYGCVTCHDAAQRAPNLRGLFGQPVLLSDGTTVIADANYIRESILQPGAKVVYGYQPIMPSFQGRLSEDELLYLLMYIQSIGPAGGGQTP